MRTHRIAFPTLLAALLATVLGAPGEATSAARKVGRIPREGNTSVTLAAAWWEWAYGIPFAENPVFNDPTGAFCDVGQGGTTWFLAGSGGGIVERSCTIPADQQLFFPLFNWVVFCPLPGETPKDLRDQVTELIDVPLAEGTVVLEASVDGVPIENLFDSRATSPPFTVPGGGVIEEWVPECAGTPGVADGFWLKLQPLAPGEHLLQFHAAYGAFEHSLFGPIGAFDLSVIYHLTIE